MLVGLEPLKLQHTQVLFNMDRKLLVFVLGAPGAGKGTQSDLILKEFAGWSHLSAGDLLRAQVQAGTELGLQAQQCIREGKLVPGSMIVGLLRDALINGQHDKVLIDGFPRELEQLQDFDQQVRPCSAALFYNVAEETAQQRLVQRGESSGRVDDNEETIRNRFAVFREQSMPVVKALQEQGKLIEIDAAASPEEVFAATKQAIQQLEQQQLAEQQQQAPAEVSEAAPAAAEEGAAAAEAVSASASETPAEADVGLAEPTAQASSAAVLEPTVVTVADDAQQSEPAVPAAVEDTANIEGNAAVAAMAAQQAASTEEVPSDAAQPADIPGAAESDKAQEATAAAAAAPVSIAELQMDLSSIRTPVVICGPSGVGKGTLIEKLMKQYPDRFGFSVSHTTRGPRPGEQHGVHYYFTDPAAMRQQIDAGMFLEHAEVHGNMYGTSLAAVARVSSEGRHCVLDIDVQGAQLVKASALGHACLFIFIAPPSHEELERRLRNRGTETEEKVLQRLANAESEIAKAEEPGLFDHVLVNDNLESAYYQLQMLINQRIPGLLPEVLTVTPPQPTAVAVEAAPVPTVATAEAVAPAPLDTAVVQPAATPPAVVAAANSTEHAAPAAPAAAESTAAVAAAAPVPEPQANGSAAAAAGGTSTLLDFGFGASAGPAVAVKGMPVRQYMDVTVLPVLREGLKALNVARPDDPWQFLADYLVAHKPVAH